MNVVHLVWDVAAALLMAGIALWCWRNSKDLLEAARKFADIAERLHEAARELEATREVLEGLREAAVTALETPVGDPKYNEVMAHLGTLLAKLAADKRLRLAFAHMTGADPLTSKPGAIIESPTEAPKP